MKKDKNKKIWRRRKNQPPGKIVDSFFTCLQSVRFPHRHRRAAEKSENRNDCPNELARRLHRSSAIIYLCMLYGYGGMANCWTLLFFFCFFGCVLCEEEQNRSGAMGTLYVAICRWVCQSTCTLCMCTWADCSYYLPTYGCGEQKPTCKLQVYGYGLSGIPTPKKEIFLKVNLVHFRVWGKKRACVHIFC